MSKVYQLKKVQVIPASIEKAWKYFSTPENLETITSAAPMALLFSI